MLVFLLPHFPDSSAVLSLLPNGNLLADLELALLSSPFHLPTPIGAFWCHLSNKLLSFKFYSRGLLLGQTQSKTPVYSFPCHWTSGFQFFTLTKLQHISTNLSVCLALYMEVFFQFLSVSGTAGLNGMCIFNLNKYCQHFKTDSVKYWWECYI